MNPCASLALLLSLACPLLAADTPAPATPPHRVYGVWHSSEIGGGGYLQQVHFCLTDPNRLYMTSDVGGLFRSDDRGATWRMVRGNLPAGGGAYEVRGMLVNPADADHVLIACGSPWGRAKGIYITRDGGSTWKQTLSAMFPGNGDSRGNGKILVPSPADEKLLLAGADEGIYRSTDFGETWSEVTGPKNLFSPSDIVFDRTNPNRVWLCVAGWGKERTMGLFVSEDAGQSFRKLADRSPSEIVQDPVDPNTLYGLFNQRPAKSSDGAASWTPLEDGLAPKNNDARSDGQYAAITVGKDFILLGGHGGNFYRLPAGGSKWEKVAREAVDEGQWWGRMREGMYNHFGSALGYTAIDPRDENRWYFTDWYACYISPDAGRNWKLAIDGVEMTVIHTVVQDPADPKLVHVGMADLGYFRSTDSGARFEWNSKGISNNIKSIATTLAQPGRMYAVGPKQWHWYANQVFVSDDFGQRWRRPAMKGLPNMEEARCNTIAASQTEPNVAYLTISGPIAPNQGGVYRTDDAGMNWTWIGQGMPQQDSFFRTDIWVHGPEVAAARDGSLMAISCNRGQIVRFDPAAKAWSAVARPGRGQGGPNGVIADPSTPPRFYLAMKEGGLFRTDDAGITWNQLTNRDVYWVAVDALNSQRLAATTWDGAIASNDGGKTWHELDSALPYRHPRNVVGIAGDRIFVGTGGNGVFWAPFPTGMGKAAALQPLEPLRAGMKEVSFLRNGDMSAGTAEPQDWQLSSYKVGKVALKRDTSTCRSAPAALLVQTDGPATSFAHQRLDPYPTGPITIRGQAKVQGQFKTAQIAIQLFDANWKQIDWKAVTTLGSSGDWQEFSATVTLPENASNALFGLSFDGTGRIWIDDVTVSGGGGVGPTAPGQPSAPSTPHAPPAQADPPLAAPLPLQVSASDSRLHYVGRFDTSDSSAPRCAWSGSTVQIRFVGSAINVILNGGNDNRFVAVVDGKAGKPFYARGKRAVAIATDLPEVLHTIEIMKITEPIFGAATFHGFELSPNAQVFAVPPPKRQIEVIGDSISCGYGNEAPNEREHFTHATENAYHTYAAMAGRRLDADVHIIAWSGKLMAPNNTLPEIYNRILPQDATSRWTPGRWKPDALVINLGTNDFAGGNPEEEMWIRAYKLFLMKLRSQYPHAAIFCTIGPMLTDPHSPSKSALSTCRRYLQRIVKESNDSGDRQVYFLEFPMQTGSLGFGADWHPSIRQHEAMANVLIPALREKLNWPGAR